MSLIECSINYILINDVDAVVDIKQIYDRDVILINEIHEVNVKPKSE